MYVFLFWYCEDVAATKHLFSFVKCHAWTYWVKLHKFFLFNKWKYKLKTIEREREKWLVRIIQYTYTSHQQEIHQWARIWDAILYFSFCNRWSSLKMPFLFNPIPIESVDYFMISRFILPNQKKKNNDKQSKKSFTQTRALAHTHTHLHMQLIVFRIKIYSKIVVITMKTMQTLKYIIAITSCVV